jgi:hypothetical protein
MMKNKHALGQVLSRNAQKQIKGGTTFYCQRCYSRPGSLFLTVCEMSLLICTMPDCNNACNGRPGCFLQCTEGEPLDI